MRLKGINPIEQHVEKLVLAVVGVVFLGVLAMQFLVSPNAVDYDGQPVPPDEVLKRLGTEAEGVLGKMTDPDPELPEVRTPDLRSRFDSAFSEPVLRAERVASVPLGESFELQIAEVENLDGPVTPLRLPAPSGVLAASQWSTVDPFFARANPELTEYLPVSQPKDTVTVSVETVISGKAIESALRESGEGGRAIPSHWWTVGGRGLIEVLSVEVERQERLADGSWSDPVPVEQVRWSGGVMDAFNEGAGEGETKTWETLRPADLLELARMAQDDPSLVSQPPYLSTISGVEWVAPSKLDERAARLEIDAQIGRVEQDIARLEEELARLEERQSGRARDPQRRRDPAGGARTSSGGGGIVFGGGGSRGSGGSAQRDDPVEAQITRKQEQIAEKETQLDALIAQLEEQDPSAGSQRSARRPTRPSGPGAGGTRLTPIILGGDPSGGSRRSTGATTRRSRTPGVESPGPLLEQEAYQVWMHDLTAEPGAEYQYRMRFGVNNPLFGRERSLGSDDEELLSVAKQPLVMSPWSEWSEPVTVGREMYYFVTAARDRGQLGQGSASATAEVYQMYYGYYRKHTLSLEPGMAVQGTFQLPPDLPEFVDLKNTPKDALMAYFDERESEQTQRADPESPPVERPWLEMMDPELKVPLDMVLLDVADYPVVEEVGIDGSRQRRLMEVFFFDPELGVVARRPDQDRNMAEYSVVERSSRLAETAEIRRPDPANVP